MPGTERENISRRDIRASAWVLMMATTTINAINAIMVIDHVALELELFMLVDDGWKRVVGCDGDGLKDGG
jgi:hypothetical protein